MAEVLGRAQRQVCAGQDEENDEQRLLETAQQGMDPGALGIRDAVGDDHAQAQRHHQV